MLYNDQLDIGTIRNIRRAVTADAQFLSGTVKSVGQNMSINTFDSLGEALFHCQQVTEPMTQDILEDLWRRRLDTLTSGIANGDPYYLQIANAAEHISAEHQGRFLIELIQNANDQAVRQGLTNSFVSIIRTEQLIAVGNSGQP